MFHLAPKQYWKKLLHTLNQPSGAYFKMKKNLDGFGEKLYGERLVQIDHRIYEKLYKALDIRDAGELKSVLLEYGYGPKVRNAIESIEMMYKGRHRMSGDPEIVHFLQVAVFSAATGGSKNEVVLALLHDVIEDLKEHPEMKYAYFEGGKKRVLGTPEETMGYVQREFGNYVADRLEILTRKKELGQTYEEYLDEVVSDPITDKLKKIDKIVNLWNLDRIIDVEEKKRMVPRTLQKTWSQVLVTRDDWLYEVLQYAWQGVVDWAMIQDELKAPRTPLQENAISRGLSKPPGRNHHFANQMPIHEESGKRGWETPAPHPATKQP